MPTAPDHLQRTAIEFENGRSAEALYANQPVQAQEILTALGIAVPAA